MNEWDEAAEKASMNIVLEHGKDLFPSAQADEIRDHITDAYAELMATHEKLAQIASLFNNMANDRTCAIESSYWAVLKPLLADPSVVAEMQKEVRNG